MDTLFPVSRRIVEKEINSNTSDYFFFRDSLLVVND